MAEQVTLIQSIATMLALVVATVVAYLSRTTVASVASSASSANTTLTEALQKSLDTMSSLSEVYINTIRDQTAEIAALKQRVAVLEAELKEAKKPSRASAKKTGTRKTKKATQ